MSRTHFLVGAIVLIAVIGLSAGAAYVFFGRETDTVFFNELGVKVKVPDRDAEIVYSVEPVAGIGQVLYVSTAPIREAGGSSCNLGVLYFAPEESVAAGTFYLERSDLEARLARAGGNPPTAKKLPSGYLVFDPAKENCSADPKTEEQVRTDLWKALQKAEPIS